MGSRVSRHVLFLSLSQFYFFLSWPISLLGFMERIPFLVFNKMWECTCSNSDIVPLTDVVNVYRYAGVRSYTMLLHQSDQL